MNEIIIALCHDRFEDNHLAHYGQEGMHWGYRNYQPYDEGYIPKHKGIFLGTVFKKKDPYRYLNKANSMDYLTGKRSAYEDVRKGSDTGHLIKKSLQDAVGSTKKSFDKWNKLDRAYSYDEAQRIKKDALEATRLAKDWESKLDSYRKDAFSAAMRRGLNAENVLDKRGDIKGRESLIEKHKKEGYRSYYTDREKDVLASLERIAETYSARQSLRSKQYFEYEARSNAPKTKTEKLRRDIDSRLNKTKSYAKEYADIVREMMQSPVSKAMDTSTRIKYQKEIESIQSKAMKLKNNQNIINAIRASARDIDQDLITYYSGKTSILPEAQIRSKFWDPNFFEYDAD